MDPLLSMVTITSLVCVCNNDDVIIVTAHVIWSQLLFNCNITRLPVNAIAHFKHVQYDHCLIKHLSICLTCQGT